MIYKLEGTVITNQQSNSIVSLDFPNDSIITALLLGYTTFGGLDAAGDYVVSELSFMSTNSFGSNDVRGSIAMWSANQQFLTSGGGTGFAWIALTGLMVEIASGERIHMHSNATNGPVAQSIAYIYAEDDVELISQRPSRRRR